MSALPAILPTLLTVGSTALSVIGAISQGNAQAAQYRAQAQAQEYNARISQQNATIASQQSNAREDRQRREARQVLGAQRASLVQNLGGLYGSAGDIAEQSARNAELDALNIRYEGELQRRGYLSQADLDNQQAQQARANASAAKRAGYVSAGAAALSGAAKGYTQYQSMQDTSPAGMLVGNGLPRYNTRLASGGL